MSTTTMHFGPEWMRSKPQAPQRSQAPPSPPPASNLPSATSTYSALVSALPASQNDTQDDAHPFRYTKDELLRIYKESPKGGLGLEVERWEGVVREIGSDPVGLREMGEGEKKLFAGPLNSDLRRRQSTDYLSPLNMSSLGGDRPRLNHNPSSGACSPLRERYPGLKRRDSNAESPTTTLPRKQSFSTLTSPAVGARGGPMPSPRVRQGFSGGFDGVLGAGETWTSRRRASEASRPGAITRDTSGGGDVDNAEKLTALGEGQAIDKGSDQSSVSASHQPETIPATSGSSSHAQVSAEATQVSNNVASTNPPGDGPLLPTDPKELAAVEWSYKDPTGAVQGPFRADVMQKWYDDGYFALDLPMKRVLYDRDWITVKELTQRATSDKVFMCILRPVAPPGLTKREASPLHSVLQPPMEQNAFAGPYQPAPIRSLRSSTLDSFNGSNPSDSPSSSIGGHFGNNSPDPLAFGGRGGNGNLFMGDTGAGLGFSGGLDLGGLRRTHLQDFGQEPHRLHSPSYSNAIGNQGFGTNGHGFSGQFNPVQSSPWGTQHDPFNGYNNNYALSASSYNAQSPFNGQLPNQILGNPINPLLYGSTDPGVNTLSNQFNAPNHAAEQHGYPQGYVGQYQQPSNPAVPAGESAEYQIRQDGQFGGSASQGIPSAWDGPSETPSRRTTVFDSGHPTTLNTSVPTASSQSSPWAQTQPPAPATQPMNASKDVSPWLLSSQGVLEWGSPAEPEIPVATTVELEKLVEEPEVLESTQSPVDLETTETSEPSPSSQGPEEVAPIEPVPAPAPKGKKSKSVPAPVPVPAEVLVVTPTATPVTPAQKAPWAKDEKKKGKSSGAAISLRDIQDAEAKAAEARKAREEKERANRIATSISTSSDSKEDQPFTASWGLPTSQAGGRTSSFNKDAAPTGPSPVSPVPPVWTNAGKPAATRKTMKEIQEEEERRKKTATAKETVAAAAAKRVYAETTAKATTPSAPPSANNAWVTVGSSGKTNAAVVAPPRPTAASVAAASTSARPNGIPALRPATQAPASKPAASPISGKGEDFPVTPSHEFLKWLTESLKGLNNSVNVEEIISMLLSFSLDPDPVAIEIIQETIYANSTTLDGRRFAAEFVAKRKADAANRKGGNGAGKAPARPVSIAEVVKATPKSSQPEWGGFKVVNKKKKGARS